MKLRIALLASAVAALVVAAPALAKGPSEATIKGPGLKGGAIHLKSSGGGDPSAGTPLGELVESTGYFAAVFGQQPDPMVDKKPAGDLGPKYRIDYNVPTPTGKVRLKQDLYPYAPGGPISYMRPGQPVFEGMVTRGGWFIAPRDFKGRLVGLGLPATAPSGGSSGGWSVPWTPLSIAAVTLLLAALTTLVVTRRVRPAGA